MKKFFNFLYPWLDMDVRIYKLYKKSNYWYKKKHINIAKYYAYKIYRKYGCWISPNAIIGENFSLPHPIGIVIGAKVIIGDNVTIYQNVTVGRKKIECDDYPIIEDGVTVYCNSIVLGNIRLKEKSIIGCNSVVLRNVESSEVVYGVVK